MKLQLKIHIYTLLLLFCFGNSLAQKNAAARYEIDAKRIGVWPEGKEALPRSREFIRLDSTYYVGYMYEGLYKTDRASDYIGYKNAIPPLYKALTLIDKDYGSRLRKIYSSINYYNQNRALFEDLYQIFLGLHDCYGSIEMPDSMMNLLNKIDSYDFQKDLFMVGARRAWVYHRNRFYTSEKYPFLKNTIKENEQMAYMECYKNIERIKKNKNVNDYWFGPYQSNGDLLYVYHNLAILHDYNQYYDSSHYYYDILIQGGAVSWNNYANMLHETGDFAGAVENYAKVHSYSKFQLSEPDYYLPIILVYGGQTKNAINIAKNKIEETGSTPGFGWYNISLARGYLYDGQLDSANFFLDKAANFKELHINTTLTQSQYEFSINLLRIQVLNKKMQLIKFSNTNWWYSPKDIYDFLSLKTEKVMLEYAVVNAMAGNPERNRIVYDLFCSETTVSYDESMALLKDFCLPFFEAKYNMYAQTDPRQRVNRYFRLFAAKFALEQGETERAKTELYTLLEQTMPTGESVADNLVKADPIYERLYIYRLLEALTIADEEGINTTLYKNKCFEAYPQLMPYSGITCKMNVAFSGMEDDEVVKKVIDDIKDCDIELSNEEDIPKAEINFEKKGDTYRVIINVWSDKGKMIVTNGEMLFKNKDGVGRELALRLFGKGGATMYTAPLD